LPNFFWIFIGDGNYPIIPGTEDSILLPLDLVMTERGLPALINFVYPRLSENYRNVDYMVGKAILTPKNVDIEKISDLVLDQLPGNYTIYPSADSTDLSEDGNTSQPQVYFPKFLRSLKIPNLPPDELKLKVGVPIILLQNLAPSQGLCNRTRLICRALQNKVIEAEIITGSHVGSHIFIPRMTLSPSDSSLPFILKRRQFPIRVAFSMTINKSQDQTLSRVGLYLPHPVFSHGQLYVALSRITSYQNIKVFIDNGCVNSQKCQTRNVVYKEVFV
jgi:ATP-dependent DNA helicase PIF1